jgi:hypothetical protein
VNRSCNDIQAENQIELFLTVNIPGEYIYSPNDFKDIRGILKIYGEYLKYRQ